MQANRNNARSEASVIKRMRRATAARGKDLIARLVYTGDGFPPTASKNRRKPDFRNQVAELLVRVERSKRSIERQRNQRQVVPLIGDIEIFQCVSVLSESRLGGGHIKRRPGATIESFLGDT